MNRTDWMVVGMRLYGIYLCVSALETLAGVLFLPAQAAPLAASPLAAIVLRSFLGTVLIFGAEAIGRRLEARDGSAAAEAGSGADPVRR